MKNYFYKQTGCFGMVGLVSISTVDIDYKLVKLFLKRSENIWSVVSCPVL